MDHLSMRAPLIFLRVLPNDERPLPLTPDPKKMIFSNFLRSIA